MQNISLKQGLTLTTLAISAILSSSTANADAVTDWNLIAIKATKGVDPSLTAGGNPTIALNSNVATRIEAIAARAVFDAVNAINNFSNTSYYYQNTSAKSGLTSASASIAAAQAAHDVLLSTLPSTAAWTNTRSWLDSQLNNYFTTLNANINDPGVNIGKAAASAAVNARSADFSSIRTTYTPSSNLSVNAAGNAVVPNDTGNPGIGLWRPSNAGSSFIDPITGAPTGFDASGNSLPAAAIDFNWKNVTPFTLSTESKQELVAQVPPTIVIGSPEYTQELAFVQSHGQDSAHPGLRTNDQLLQALYYKQDAELFTNEAARIASAANSFSLNQNAKLFAALDSVVADARVAAFQSKYDLDFWRPITALNADSSGKVNDYSAWKPLAATPSHPASTGGHSTTVAAGVEVLRAFFKSDYLQPNQSAVTLTSLPWLVSTNNGTGKLQSPVNGQDSTSRSVTTFSQIQLENGRSRVYLGVHWASDDLQGQILGLSLADFVLAAKTEPALIGTTPYTPKNNSVVSVRNIYSTFVNNSDVSGFYGLSGWTR